MRVLETGGAKHNISYIVRFSISRRRLLAKWGTNSFSVYLTREVQRFVTFATAVAVSRNFAMLLNYSKVSHSFYFYLFCINCK